MPYVHHAGQHTATAMAAAAPTWGELAAEPEESLPWEQEDDAGEVGDAEEQQQPEQQQPPPSEAELAAAARGAADAQAELEAAEAALEWEESESRRLNHAVTCAFAARDFAEVGDLKQAVGAARQSLGLDPTNIEARAVLNYCRNLRRRNAGGPAAARPAPSPRKQRRSRVSLGGRSSLSTSFSADGPAFALIDGESARRTVVGNRPVSAASSFASLNGLSMGGGVSDVSLNAQPRTLYVLNTPSRSSVKGSRRRASRAQPAADEQAAAAVSAQLSYHLLRETKSGTAWVTTGPAPDNIEWGGDSELLARVESLEAAVSDMQPEPEPEPEPEFFEVQTELSGGALDALTYVYAQAAHLYSFVPGDGIQVLSRRRVRDKESGEETVAETWHPAVVTNYVQPYLSEPEREKAESDARAEAAAAKQRELEDEVSFQWKNPDFLLKNSDFLSRNPDFLLKNVDFRLKNVDSIIQHRREWPISSRMMTVRRLQLRRYGRRSGRRRGLRSCAAS